MPRFGKSSSTSDLSSSRLPGDPAFLSAREAKRSSQRSHESTASNEPTRRFDAFRQPPAQQRRHQDFSASAAQAPRRSFEQSYMDSWSSSEFLRENRESSAPTRSTPSIFYHRYQRNSYSEARLAPRYANQIELGNGRPLRPSLKGIPDPRAQVSSHGQEGYSSATSRWPSMPSQTTKIAPLYNPRKASKPIASRRRPRSPEDQTRDDGRGERASAPTNVSSLHEKLHNARHAYRHHKVDRIFAASAGAYPSSEDEGPRAALIKGRMGSRQKKASRMQRDSQPASLSRSSRGGLAGLLQQFERPRMMVGLLVACCLMASFLFVYPAAQDYYTAIRTNDQLEAEYQAIVDRNDEIQDRINVLQTDEGIEDKVRNEFGWVKAGENAVSVGRQGSSDIGSDAQNQTAAITTGSVPAPETWYSSFLDPFFGYRS